MPPQLQPSLPSLSTSLGSNHLTLRLRTWGWLYQKLSSRIGQKYYGNPLRPHEIEILPGLQVTLRYSRTMDTLLHSRIVLYSALSSSHFSRILLNGSSLRRARLVARQRRIHVLMRLSRYFSRPRRAAPSRPILTRPPCGHFLIGAPTSSRRSTCRNIIDEEGSHG